MKPSEAIATIRAARKAVTNWNPDAEPWPDAAITAAHAAIVELVQYYAAMGQAKGHNPRPVTAANILMLANLRLDHLAGKAKTDPEARVQIVAELADLSSVLVEDAADIGVKTSREQREKARKPRKQAETKELCDTARVVVEELRSSRRGRRITDAEIARETGKRRWGDDVSRWPMKERALYDRLRKHMKTPLRNYD